MKSLETSTCYWIYRLDSGGEAKYSDPHHLMFLGTQLATSPKAAVEKFIDFAEPLKAGTYLALPQDQVMYTNHIYVDTTVKTYRENIDR